MTYDSSETCYPGPRGFLALGGASDLLARGLGASESLSHPHSQALFPYSGKRPWERGLTS